MNLRSYSTSRRTRAVLHARKLYAVGALITLASGCSTEPTPSESAEQAAGGFKNELGVYPLELGDGLLIDPSGISSPLRGSCVDSIPELDSRPTLDVSAVAISARSKAEMIQKLNITLGAEGPIQGIKAKLDVAFDGRYSRKLDIENFALIVRIGSVGQTARLGQPSEQNLCRTPRGGSIDSLERFRNECGDRWSNRHELGGYLTVTWDTSMLTQHQAEELKSKLGVGNSAESGLANLSARLSSVSTVSLSLNQINVDANGYPTLGATNIPAFLAYLNSLTSSISAAVARGDLNDPSYGTVIRQHFRAYTAGELAVCTALEKLPHDVDEALECKSDVLVRADELKDTASVLGARIDTVNGWLNPARDLRARMIWPAPEAVNRQASQAWLTRALACRADAVKAADTCTAAFNDWSYVISTGGRPAPASDVCTSCVLPAGCDPADLISEGMGLSAPSIGPVGTSPVHREYSVRAGDPPVVLGAIDQVVCALTGVHGAFRGGGEWAGVEVSNGRYLLRYDTQRTSAYELGHASATCVAIEHWDNGTGAPRLLGPATDACEASSGTRDCTVPATTGFLQLSALHGRFDDHQPPPNPARAQDFARLELLPEGGIDGSVRVSESGGSLARMQWTTSGVDLVGRRSTPLLALPQPLSRADALGSRRASALGVRPSEGLCYFTQLGGMLWAAGDGARLEQTESDWILVTHSQCWSAVGNLFPGCERRLIEASVQCVKFDQR